MKELRTITEEELKNILAKHEKWLRTGHKEGTRADLRRANFKGSNLNWLDFNDADLREACLIDADLREACLIGADLRNADLRNADLTRADLYGANLRNADLSDANLSEARLDGAKYFVPAVCPTEGPFIAWKKAWTKDAFTLHDGCMPLDHNGNIALNAIVKLLIPEDALRSSGTSRKCRASKAVILDIQSLEGESLKDVAAYSVYKASFVYKIGETITPDSFDKNRFNECSHGIHFFIDRQEAVNYLI